MRVAYLINQYPKVTHTFVRTEIAALERAGVQVDRIAMRRSPTALLDAADRREERRTRVVLESGAPAILADVARAAATHPRGFARALAMTLRMSRRSDRGLVRHLAYLAEACVLLRWFAADPVPHVHAHFGANPAQIALLWRLLDGPPYSFTAHGPEEFERADVLGIRELVARAAFVVVVSDAGREHLRQLCVPELWDRIALVRCGVDERFLADAPPPPAARRIVFVGRLSPEKAPLLLLDAVARLAAGGESCELTMIGDGPLRAAVESRRRSLALEDRVRLAGWAGADTVREEILRARALVLPSFAEGLPVVLMEALALHRPVVCTAVGGVAELVEHGVSGWVVPPGSIGALVEAIRTALQASPERLAEMGRRGAERVRAQHDPDAAARTLAALFSGGRP